MLIVHTIKEARDHLASARSAGNRVGFVPTMGFLHPGHISLVETSRKYSDYQAMSIFVNKIQFNDKKDYESYPRELERDFEMARKAGVDLMFVPDDEEMYDNRLTYVDVDMLTEHLCGAHRPGHFRGVYTVVSKLFNIIQPQVSVFGQKDIQQAVTIEKMVRDLNFPVEIIIAPTVREERRSGDEFPEQAPDLPKHENVPCPFIEASGRRKAHLPPVNGIALSSLTN